MTETSGAREPRRQSAGASHDAGEPEREQDDARRAAAAKERTLDPDERQRRLSPRRKAAGPRLKRTRRRVDAERAPSEGSQERPVDPS
jgi:hypothetical protein